MKRLDTSTCSDFAMSKGGKLHYLATMGISLLVIPYTVAPSSLKEFIISQLTLMGVI